MNITFPLTAGLIASMLHVITGAAISVVDKEEAKKTFDILKQLGELHDLDTPDLN